MSKVLLVTSLESNASLDILAVPSLLYISYREMLPIYATIELMELGLRNNRYHIKNR